MDTPSGSSQAFPPGKNPPPRSSERAAASPPVGSPGFRGGVFGFFQFGFFGENHGKMMGNPWKIQGKLTEIMGKSWENEDKPQYKGWANHGKLWEV